MERFFEDDEEEEILTFRYHCVGLPDLEETGPSRPCGRRSQTDPILRQATSSIGQDSSDPPPHRELSLPGPARETRMPEVSLIDRSAKVLARRVPEAFCRLAGIEVAGAALSFEDVSINLPEYRADQVLIIERPGVRWGWHLEYQLRPDRQQTLGWLFKNLALNQQLGIPVVLSVLYLTREGRRRFPASCTIAGDGPRNRHLLHTIQLWEHAERIRSGELAGLAPFLVLCEDNPSAATLQRERELILGAGLSRPVQADLLSVALTVAGRYFPRDLLLAHFREELEMLKEAGIVEEWIREAEAKAEARGEASGLRRAVEAVLASRFGPLPPGVVAALAAAEPDTLEMWLRRGAHAERLTDVGLL